MIYSVEDDAQIREMVLYALRQSGLSAEGFAEAGAFWSALSRQVPSLVLLDIMLPGEDGLSILQRLRRQPETRGIPVILLTAKGAEMDKVLGLNAGADDYLAKPFSVLELVARVNALLRRAGKPEEKPLLRAGALSLHRETRDVQAAGQPVALTLKEFQLLEYLMRHPDVVCSRERLLAAVWDDAYMGNTRTVDAHIKTLRQKLGAGGEAIETVRGVGYRLRGQTCERG